MRVVVLGLLLVCVDVQAAGLFGGKPQVGKEQLDMCQKVQQKVESELVQHKNMVDSLTQVKDMKERAAQNLAETNDQLQARVKKLEAALIHAQKGFSSVEQDLKQIKDQLEIFKQQQTSSTQAVQEVVRKLSAAVSG